MDDPGSNLWLVRHGETEWSRAGRHTGRTDLPLTPAGVTQAASLRDRLAGHAFALVLSSPLRRALDTCRLAGFEDQVRLEPDLMEWDYGTAEGHTRTELQRDVPGWSVWADGVQGGERIDEVAARARRVIDRATGAGGDALLFAHGHVLRILAATWLGLDPREARLLALDTASIGVLGHEHGARVLRRWNL